MGGLNVAVEWRERRWCGRSMINNYKGGGSVGWQLWDCGPLLRTKDISLENSFLAVENSLRIGAPVLSTKTKSSLTKSDSLCSRGSPHMTQDDENDVNDLDDKAEDPLKPTTVNHKEIRLAAIRKKMEEFILKTKLTQTAADWATDVDDLTAPVIKSAEK
eukprot:scaffold21865_cov74-Skeletonema_menzelii.AAC.1